MKPAPVPYSEDYWLSLPYWKRYALKNPGRHHRYYLECWKGNPKRAEATLASWHRWRDRDPQRHRVKNAKWRRDNPAVVNFMNRRREHQQKGAAGSHTFQEWEELKAHFHYTCPGCGRSEPQIKLTEDHIIPISKGGTEDISNIQPLCTECNSRKGTKVVAFQPLEVVVPS